jgi:hypothetical protein
MLAIRIAGNQLKAGRCVAGLSQSDLAERSGLCVFSIRRYEQAADAVPCAVVSALNRVVNVLEDSGVRFGGMCAGSLRPMFECTCGRRAFKLFHHRGRFAGCKKCIGIPYACQQRSTKDRPRLQAARLRRFLGSLPDSTKAPPKPPLMHRHTYARLVNQLRRLEMGAPRNQQSISKKLGHTVLRPTMMYRTQLTSVANF